MIALLAAAMLAAQPAAAADSAEIANAIETNRLEQARQMLATATAAGQAGPEIERLRADLAFARKNWPDARERYVALAGANPGDGRSAERAAIASIMLGDRVTAAKLLDQATESGSASWRAWNAKGVLCDYQGDWAGADEAFAAATSMAPDEAEILNNRGWSLLLRGEWARALPLLEQAVALDPRSSRSRNNLELARAAVAEDLPQRRQGESDSDFAARLNDAGVAAAQRGQRSKAIAAFSRALAVRDKWFPRAANNLAAVEGK
jgi:Flp pilus assembly protein TadD